MKIALLAPAGAMHRYNGLFHKNLHYAPITLALLAALVPEDLCAEVNIYDETAEPIPLDLEADIVAMTCITGTASRTYRYADYFRSLGMTVFLGGVHPTLMPDEAKDHADSIFVGMAEETFPQALRDWQAGQLKPYYREPEGASIAGRPLPRKDLLKKKKYITLNTVEAVRGCCHACTFCAYPEAFGKKVITRPIEDIVAEIKSFKGKIVLFPDVNLIADRAYAVELCKALIPLKKWWFGLTTSVIDRDEELLSLMRKSGCKGLLIGLESVNQATQQGFHKGVNQVAGYQGLMSSLHKNGIMVMGCFAFGSDEDYKDVFARTVAMCEEAKIDLPRFAVITPFPRTPYYRELAAAGRIVEKDWGMYDVEHVVYEPKNMTKPELEAGLLSAWRSAYSWRGILRRIDWRNILRLHVGYLVFFLANIGYRQYAGRMEGFDDAAMVDNSDIPLPATPSQAVGT